MAGAAVLYLLFLGLWGLNYRRVPLERKLDYDRSRVTRDAAMALANTAAGFMNRGYAAAHAGSRRTSPSLERSFADVQRALGARRAAVPGVPKRSVLTWYFRRAAIDGMTDPFFLEIIVNPEVLDVERPFVVAHEWAHLAGYANESEANFVAWLTCVRGDALAQYSGWVSAYEHAARALSREDRRAADAARSRTARRSAHDCGAVRANLSGGSAGRAADSTMAICGQTASPKGLGATRPS